MSLSLFLKQSQTCLVRLTWMICEVRVKWLYSYCLVGYCFQDLFKIALRILVSFPSSLLSIRLISVQVVHLYSNSNTATTWNFFILFYRRPYPTLSLSLSLSLSSIVMWYRFILKLYWNICLSLSISITNSFSSLILSQCLSLFTNLFYTCLVSRAKNKIPAFHAQKGDWFWVGE